MSVNNCILLIGTLKYKPRVFKPIVFMLINTYPKYNHGHGNVLPVRYFSKNPNKISNLTNLDVGYKIAIMGHVESRLSQTNHRYYPQIMADVVKPLETKDEYLARKNSIGSVVTNTQPMSKYQLNDIHKLTFQVASKYNTSTKRIKNWFSKEFNITDNTDKYQASCIISTLNRFLKK